jgi:radical SAM superfamily enzyme YgiQ (UPF0313 family)
MNLGILRVAAVLEQAGHVIDFLDLSGIENYLDVVEDYLKVSTVNVFGLTATTPQLPTAVIVCRAIRTHRPKAKIILGGAHVTSVVASYKHEQKMGNIGRATRVMDKLYALFDVLVAGDGERAVFVAIEPNSPKLVDASDPKSSLFLTRDQIDELPHPARYLVDVDGYDFTIDGQRALSIMSQQGCPYNCGFCGGRASPCMRRVRSQSIENTVSEMVQLHNEYGISGFMFYDDELNLKNTRMLHLMDALTRAQRQVDCEFRLRGFVRSNLFTDEQASVMYQAGFRVILVGFESGSPRMLCNMNKQATVEDNTRCMDIAKRHGLKVKAAMSIGHPGESRETLEQTRQWLLQVRPDAIDMSIVTPYPGSPYYDQAVTCSDDGNIWVYTVNQDNLYSYDVDYTTEEHFYKGNPYGGYTSYVFTDYLSAEDLVRLRGDLARETRQTIGIPFDPKIGRTRYARSNGRIPSSIYRTTAIVC